MSRTRRGHGNIRSEHQQRAHAAFGAERIQHLVGGTASLRQIGFVNSPNARYKGAMFRIVDAAITGQLIGLLAMFAAALAVALPCQATVPAMQFAHSAQRQREVDEAQHVVDALALLFRSTRGQNHGRFGLA